MASLPAPPPPLAGLRILILGRGRVGRAFVVALGASGAAVSQAAGNSSDVSAADVVLLCVPDDAIAEVADRVAQSVRPGQVIAHTSGRHGLAVLDPVRRVGAHGLAFHPAMTFTGSPADAGRLAGARVGSTADPGARAVAERLCAALGATLTVIAEDQRALYHAGLSHAANHLVTLIAEAQSLLTLAGVEDPSVVLAPLVTAALAGALDRGALATTGPVVRGDAGTVATHVRALRMAAPEVLPSYSALAAGTLRLARADGRVSEASAANIRDVLEGISA